MMNPDIVTGVSLFLLFAMVAVIFGTGVDSILGFSAVLIAHITFNLPYVILSVTPKIRQLDRHLTEAALDLGCTPFSAFCTASKPSPCGEGAEPCEADEGAPFASCVSLVPVSCAVPRASS